MRGYSGKEKTLSIPEAQSGPSAAAKAIELKLRRWSRPRPRKRHFRSARAKIQVVGMAHAQIAQHLRSTEAAKKQIDRRQPIRKPRKELLKASTGTSGKDQRFSTLSLQLVPSACVGQMAHGDRATIGGHADILPSTLALSDGTSNHSDENSYGCGVIPASRSGGKNLLRSSMSETASARARGNASSRVFFMVEDAFSRARIRSSARELGISVEFIQSDRNLLAELTDSPREVWPVLIVVDLNNVRAKPLTLIPRLHAKLKKAVSIIGIVSRDQGDLKIRGAKAGCDSVVSRPAFSKNLPNLLRRYSSGGDRRMGGSGQTDTNTADHGATSAKSKA